MSKGIYEVTVETMFSASHQLRGYKGSIEPLHGHNFRVQASVMSRELDDVGLVIDFVELEALLKQVLAPYDHRHMNDLAPFDELNPSTENMARFVLEKLQEKLREQPTSRGLEVRCVRIWEAPGYRASFTRD